VTRGIRAFVEFDLTKQGWICTSEYIWPG